MTNLEREALTEHYAHRATAEAIMAELWHSQADCPEPDLPCCIFCKGVTSLTGDVDDPDEVAVLAYVVGAVLERVQ